MYLFLCVPCCSTHFLVSWWIPFQTKPFNICNPNVLIIIIKNKNKWKTLSATDVLVPISMKNAAKCDTSYELHPQWIIKTLNATCTSFGSMPVGVSVITNPHIMWLTASLPKRVEIYADFMEWDLYDVDNTRKYHFDECKLTSIRTSNQTRLPAEFKHITRRRKRN